MIGTLVSFLDGSEDILVIFSFLSNSVLLVEDDLEMKKAMKRSAATDLFWVSKHLTLIIREVSGPWVKF